MRQTSRFTQNLCARPVFRPVLWSESSPSRPVSLQYETDSISTFNGFGSSSSPSHSRGGAQTKPLSLEGFLAPFHGGGGEGWLVLSPGHRGGRGVPGRLGPPRLVVRRRLAWWRDAGAVRRAARPDPYRRPGRFARDSHPLVARHDVSVARPRLPNRFKALRSDHHLRGRAGRGGRKASLERPMGLRSRLAHPEVDRAGAGPRPRDAPLPDVPNVVVRFHPPDLGGVVHANPGLAVQADARGEVHEDLPFRARPADPRTIGESSPALPTADLLTAL